MRYYLGPWVLDPGTPFMPFWRPPAGVVGSIDLRSIPGHATPGVGIFVTPDSLSLDSSYRLFGQGDLRDIIPPESDRSIFASMLQIGTVEGQTLLDWLWTAITTQADPRGLTAVKPLIPTSQGNLEIHLGGHSRVASKTFTLAMPEAANVIAVIQEDYRAVRQATVEGRTFDPQLHRKFLDGLGHKYGVRNPERVFIPSDLPRETPLPRETAFTESFNKANSTTLGPDLTWTETLGDLQVLNNQFAGLTGGSDNWARAEHDVSSSDHYAQVVVAVLGVDPGDLGPIARYSASAVTFYTAILQDSGGLRSATWKAIAGTPTNIGTNTDPDTYNVGDVIRVLCNGSTISRVKNGSLQNAVTDTSISGNTRGGIQAFGNDSYRGDSFEIADIAVTGTSAVTEANDVMAASGVVTVSGTLAVTEAADTMAASGVVVVTGTQAVTEADDAMSANGAVGDVITGSMAAVEADDSISASGALSVTGSMAVIEVGDAMAASGLVSGIVVPSDAPLEYHGSGKRAGRGDLTREEVEGYYELVELRRKNADARRARAKAEPPVEIPAASEPTIAGAPSQEGARAPVLPARPKRPADIETLTEAQVQAFLKEQVRTVEARVEKLAVEMEQVRRQADEGLLLAVAMAVALDDED